MPGVLSIGSKHVSRESPAGGLKEGEALTWEKMWVETKLDGEALDAGGVRVGHKVVIARQRKASWRIGHGRFVCGHNLDCRGGLAILVEVARQLAVERPARDVYLVASSEEEIGGQGAVYSVGQLPADTLVAVDVAPAAEEYQTRNCAEPPFLSRRGERRTRASRAGDRETGWLAPARGGGRPLRPWSRRRPRRTPWRPARRPDR